MLLLGCDFLQNALQLFLQFQLGDTCQRDVSQLSHPPNVIENSQPASLGSTSISAMVSESKRSPSCAIRVETSKVWKWRQAFDVLNFRCFSGVTKK